MAKKANAVYEAGELGRVRGKLGDIDDEEAKRMARILGGDVGVEKDEEKVSRRSRSETANMPAGGRGGRSSQPRRRVELASGDEDDSSFRQPKKPLTKGDDPSLPLKISYRERVKMDRYAGQSEFDIKSSFQVLHSVIALFSYVPDKISPVFVTKRMNEYYKRIEVLVTSTRTLFPRNNTTRSERMKKASFLGYSILNTIRHWDLDRIAGDLAKIQTRPRYAYAGDFADILKAVYRPLYILERLNMEIHIKEAYKLLYKVILMESADDISKHQQLIRTSLAAYQIISKDIRFLLYPLLMKLISDRFFPYENIFSERENRFLAFIGASENDQLEPSPIQTAALEEKSQAAGESSGDDSKETTGEADGELTDEEKAKRAARDAEMKIVNRGLDTLETLFPKAGWEKLFDFPDLYPYFSRIFDFKRGGYDLIAPTDPLQQVAVLLHILDELFFGLRYINFGTVTTTEGGREQISEAMTNLLNDWHHSIQISFGKEYLPRLSDYCRVLETSAESRTSNYARRLLNELFWAKRLYFLPFYKFESIMPPPFQKKDVTALYPAIRRLRKYLTAVAASIEQGIKGGGAEANVPCDGIENPWAPYAFQIPNPLSSRLDLLLEKPQRTNASLIFFTLAVTVVLDYIVNNEGSWAYDHNSSSLFRSVKDEGIVPVFGVETDIDPDALFKGNLAKEREAKEPEQKPAAESEVKPGTAPEPQAEQKLEAQTEAKPESSPAPDPEALSTAAPPEPKIPAESTP